ncbi:MAG: VOC family protein [Phormidesmis sp.]
MKLGYVVIYVEDVKATMAFYTAAFGFETKRVFEENGSVDYGELKTGETVLGFAAHSLEERQFGIRKTPKVKKRRVRYAEITNQSALALHYVQLRRTLLPRR